MSDKQTLIKISKLTMFFDQKKLFDNLNFEIKEGDFLSIIGPNGSGKSTLLQIIMQKMRPRYGEVVYINSNFSVSKIGFVPQTRNISEDYPLNIASFIGLKFYNNFIPWITKKEKKKIEVALKTVRLDGKQQQLLAKSSGGEQQRAYIAQALVDQP